MSDFPDWFDKPPLSPTEHMRYHGYGHEDPSSILPGPEIYDVRAHYERVKRLHEQYPYKTEDACKDHAMRLALRIAKANPVMPSEDFIIAIFCSIVDLFVDEELYLHEFSHFIENPPTPTWHETIVRPKLTRDERFYTTYQSRLDSMCDALFNFYSNILKHSPDAICSKPEGASATVPFIDLFHEANSLVHTIVYLFLDQDYRDQFHNVNETIWKNLLAASGLTEEQVSKSPNRLRYPVDCDAAPAELVNTYLKDTPFEELLMTPLPFTIPEDTRFEHTHVLGGSGHGKTQFLQHQILADLSAPHPPSLIVVDSQGEMLNKIRMLALFAPGERLSDRLVLIDPEDDYSPALNVFDMTNARLTGYSRNHREQIEAGIVELYNYIFGSLAAEMTQKQGTAFSYVARLMLSIPGATIHTLLDLMEDRAPSIERSPFASQIQTLDPRSQSYFQNQFFHNSSTQTKQAVARRLYGLVRVPAFNRMFSSPRNKLDMFEAMQSGKIVLINTSKALLKSEASALFGRYMIALALYAAQERVAVPEDKRRPTFLIADEAQEYFDENLETLLSQVRKARLGLLFAHQYLDQLTPALRSAVAANTSIKIAGGVSDRDARSLAPDMRCSPDLIAGVMKKEREFAEFAYYARNLTPRAVRLKIPFGTLEAAPKMSEAAFANILARNRARYAVQAPEEEAQRKPEVKQPGAMPQQPERSNPDDISTDAAKEW